MQHDLHLRSRFALAGIAVRIEHPCEALDEPLDRWIDLQSAPSSIFAGGPVEPNALIALAATHDPLDESDENLSPITGRIASADLTADPALVAPDVDATTVPTDADMRIEAELEEAQRIARVGSFRWDVEHDKLISCSKEYARLFGNPPR